MNLHESVALGVGELARYALAPGDFIGLPRVPAADVEAVIQGRPASEAFLARVRELHRRDRELDARLPFERIERAVVDEAAHLREHGRHRTLDEIVVALSTAKVG